MLKFNVNLGRLHLCNSINSYGISTHHCGIELRWQCSSLMSFVHTSGTFSSIQMSLSRENGSLVWVFEGKNTMRDISFQYCSVCAWEKVKRYKRVIVVMAVIVVKIAWASNRQGYIYLLWRPFMCSEHLSCLLMRESIYLCMYTITYVWVLNMHSGVIGFETMSESAYMWPWTTKPVLSRWGYL